MENSQKYTNMGLDVTPFPRERMAAVKVYAEARRVAETDLRGKIDELNLAIMLAEYAKESMEAAFVKLTVAHVDLVLEQGESLSDAGHAYFINDILDEMLEASESAEDFDGYGLGRLFRVDKPSIEANKEEIDAEKHLKSPFESGEVRSSSITEVSSELTSRSLESAEDKRVAKYVVNKSVVGVQKSTQLEKSEEINLLFEHVDYKLKLEQQYGSPRQAMDIAKLKFSGVDYLKRRSGSIGLNNKSATAGQLTYDIGRFAKHVVKGVKHATKQESGTFNLEQQFGNLQQAKVLTKFKSLGSAYIKRCFGSIVHIAQVNKEGIRIMGEGAVVHTPSSIEFYDPGEKLLGNIIPSKGFIKHKLPGPTHVKSEFTNRRNVGDIGRNNLLFKHTDDKLKLEQKFGGLLQARDFAKLKLSDSAYVKRGSGRFMLIARFVSVKKGVGGSDLFKQYAYIIRSYEDTGPLIKYNRFKVSGAICLEEKLRAFNREEINFLFKHMDDKLNLEQQLSSLQHAKEFTFYEKHGNVFRHAYVKKNVKDIGINILHKYTNDKLKLSDSAHVKRCAGSIMLIVKYEFIKKGIGHGNLLGQPVFFARSSKDTGSVIKDSRLKEKYKDIGLIGEENVSSELIQF